MKKIVIQYQDWQLDYDAVNGEISVTKDEETRVYDYKRPVESVIHRGEYLMLVGAKEYLQFKFEVDNFLVGDIFDAKTDEHVREFASHVFGEDC